MRAFEGLESCIQVTNFAHVRGVCRSRGADGRSIHREKHARGLVEMATWMDARVRAYVTEDARMCV